MRCLPPSPWPAASAGLATAAIIATATACSEPKVEVEQGGELIVQQVLGPGGGEIAGGGVTLELPPRALTAETEFTFLTAVDDLSAGGFRQAGEAVAIEPAGLILKLPGKLRFADGPNAPAVLFKQDGLTVAAPGREAFINEIGVVAIAKAGSVSTSVLEPLVTTDPVITGEASAGEVHRDEVHFRMSAAATQLDLALTIYDVQGAYDKQLNGSSDGDCGFQLTHLVGGSLSAGCAGRPLTASILVENAEVEFDVIPFRSGKLQTPVAVGVVAGSAEIAFQLGFFAFDTNACFEETCSDAGVCELQGQGAICVCDDGFAPAPPPALECVCVPQCEDRLCGPNGCGGECEPGCEGGEVCDEHVGECVAGSTSTSDESGTSDSTSGDSTSGGSTTSGTN